MKAATEATHRILDLLTHAPRRLKQATHSLQTSRLYLRSDEEPWSINDILAHLRACSDVWGNSIMAMLTQDNPTQRYMSPRAWMRKPLYWDQEFNAALESFTKERRKLAKVLTNLDEAGWARRGTFTGTSPRGRDQTVLSYAERLVNHEQAHLEQIEILAK
jgi:hypothetical protein